MDKPSQLQPREQTQMGQLVLIRTSEYGYRIAEAAFERTGSKACQSSRYAAGNGAQIAVCDSDDVREAEENHLAL